MGLRVYFFVGWDFSHPKPMSGYVPMNAEQFLPWSQNLLIVSQMSSSQNCIRLL